MKRITKVHNAMQHMLLNLLCYYSWPAVTGELNKGKRSREVTSISVQEECPVWLFPSVLDFRLQVTCLKMSLLQFRFACQSGPDLLPKKKVKLHEEEEKKKKKRKRNQNAVQQKADLCAHRAVFRVHGWVKLAGLSLTRKAKFVVCMCVWFCEK